MTAPHVASQARGCAARRQHVPLEKQALSDLVQIDLQVQYEKFRRRPDDWQLPLYDMKLHDCTYGGVQQGKASSPKTRRKKSN